MQRYVALKEIASGGMQFSLTLPAAVAGEMKLQAPGDLEMHTTVPITTSEYNRAQDRTDVALTVTRPLSDIVDLFPGKST